MDWSTVRSFTVAKEARVYNPGNVQANIKIDV